MTLTGPCSSWNPGLNIAHLFCCFTSSFLYLQMPLSSLECWMTIHNVFNRLTPKGNPWGPQEEYMPTTKCKELRWHLLGTTNGSFCNSWHLLLTQISCFKHLYHIIRKYSIIERTWILHFLTFLLLIFSRLFNVKMIHRAMQRFQLGMHK